MSKTQRTLGPAAFEAYMNFADSLKDGTNNDSIDRFKYRFAVKEGYIRPKKTLTEGVGGGISLDDFEQAFKGLVGAFLPHMDEDDQEILSRVCQNLDARINSGDMAGAMDDLKGAVRTAGGDPDAFDDEDEDEDDVYVEDDECDECENCDSDSECPDGETCKDGKCVKDDDSETKEGKDLTESMKKPLNDFGKNKFHPEDNCPNIITNATVNEPKYLSDPDNYHIDDPDNPGFFGDDTNLYDELNFDDPYAPTATFRDANGWPGKDECQKKPGKANSGTPAPEALNTVTPGFGDDITEYELGDETGEPVDTLIGGNHRWPADDPGAFSDDSEPYNAPSEVDYDALADDILNNSGFGGMSRDNGGIAPSNRKFWSRR